MSTDALSSEKDAGSFFESKLALYMALVIGGAIRLAKITQSGLEPDEIHSLHLASEPSLDSMFDHHLSGSDNPHPSAHYVFHWFWIRIAGTSEIALRFPSLVMGMLTIFFIWKLGEALFNTKVGGYSAFWAAILSSMIIISVQARMYSQLVLLSTIFIYALVRILNSNTPHSPQQVAILCLSAIVLSHTHYFGTMLVFYSIFCSVLHLNFSGRSYSYLMKIGGICLLGFSPQIPHTIVDITAGDGAGYISGYMTWDILIVIISRQLNGSTILASIMIIGVLCSFYLTRKEGRLEEKLGWKILLLWWMGCFGIALVVSLVGSPVLSPANMRVVLPATIVALGAMTDTARRRAIGVGENVVPTMVIGIFLIHLLFAHQILDSTNPEIREAFEEVGEKIDENEKVILIVNAQQLTWPGNLDCYYCYNIEGEIVDVVRYHGNFVETSNIVQSSDADAIAFIHLTGWIVPMNAEEILSIEGLGEVEHRSNHEKIATAIIRL